MTTERIEIPQNLPENVAAYRIEIAETPHSPCGKFYARLIVEFRENSGVHENTKDGNYYTTLDEAQNVAETWRSGIVEAIGEHEMGK